MKKGRVGHAFQLKEHRRRWRHQLFKEQLGQCYYCGVACNEDGQENLNSFTLDHIVPISRGGTERPWNYVGACWPCNTEKGDKNVGHMISTVDKDNKPKKKIHLKEPAQKWYYRRGQKLVRKSKLMYSNKPHM